MNVVIILGYVLLNLAWIVFLYDEFSWYHTFIFKDMFLERTRFDKFQIVVLGIFCLPAIVISYVLYALLSAKRKKKLA